ncbi:MAG: DUF5717 family protein [Lachnospiraceae bacterium]|nr:DUF5717 family protein [Lachnospiraceae bacterium]
MKQVIDQILRGKFDYDIGSLSFSCEKVEITLTEPGEFEGSFHILGEPGRLTEGYVYSYDVRMECLTSHFIGSDEEISFRYNARGMRFGDTATGDFCIVSNQGEYTLSWSVVMSMAPMQSSLGEIRNLIHFTNLAKASWEEALSVFYSPSFAGILIGNDQRYLPLYRGLSRLEGSEVNMEEFLVSIGKKQRIEYIVEDTHVQLSAEGDLSHHYLSVIRNGWGATSVDVAAEGAFISLEKTHYTDNDFLGNQGHIAYDIHGENLHVGKNFGRIFLRFRGRELSVVIEVEKADPDYLRVKDVIRQEQEVFDLIRSYQNYRMKKKSKSAWMEETDRILSQMQAQHPEDPVPQLYRAQVLATQAKLNEAQWTLDRARNAIMASDDHNPVIWGYYLYLSTLLKRDENYVNSAAVDVRRLYEQYPDNWCLAWLLLYLSPEFYDSASSRWMLLQEQFERGCISPVLYIEALILWKNDPALLFHLNNHEIRILTFAARNGYLTEEIIRQLHYMAPRMREFDPRVLRILEKAYEQTPDTETLETICSYLIKGNCTGNAYLSWYEKGVEAGLKITNLIEYYMMSVDVESDRPIPKMVLLYYAYHSELDSQHKAFLFANLLRRQHDPAYQEIVESYASQIENFIIDQISRGNVNRNLAYLYRVAVTEQMLKGESARAFIPILFMNRIRITLPGTRYVILVQKGAAKEQKIPVTDGEALFPIYAREYYLLLEDEHGNRTTAEDDYVLEKMMLPGKFLKQVSAQVTDHTGLNMYLCCSEEDEIQVTDDNEMRLRQLMNAEEVDLDVRRRLPVMLASFSYNKDDMAGLDACLADLRPEGLDASSRAEAIRFFISRGMQEKAYNWICIYGIDGEDPKVIVRLISSVIADMPDLEEILRVKVAFYAFSHGKYDEVLLRYLVKFFRGRSRDLRSIWKAAEAFEVDTFDLMEHLLVQMMYTGFFIGEKMEIFARYVKQAGNPELIRAFIELSCYGYFVKDNLLHSYVLQSISRLLDGGETFSDAVALAYTRYYSKNREEIGPDEKRHIRRFLLHLSARNIYLPYFQGFIDIIPEMWRFADRTMIEYRSRPGTVTQIHYRIVQDEEDNQEYRTEPMRDMFGGVCGMSFILFFGESLQYYITENDDGVQQITESATVLRNDIGTTDFFAGSRFGMLNDMVTAEILQDYETVNTLYADYEKNLYMTRKLFRPRINRTT